MANEEHVAILKQGVETWNKWREDNPKTQPDLRDIDLRDTDLSNVNFKKTLLADSDLRGTILVAADLSNIIFEKSLLSKANLRDTKLVAADLSAVEDLIPEQLAGADISRAKIPEYMSKFKGLVNIEEASKNARKTLFIQMLACAYIALTIANTTDAQLITNFASSTLPIIGAKIPLVLFYYTAPFVLLSIFIYYHISLQRLWKELATLPAFFQDGSSLDMKVYPWLVNSVVVTHCENLKDTQKSNINFRWAISCLLAYGLTPMTLVLLWWRYLNRHDLLGTGVHIFWLLLSIFLLVFFQRNLHETFHKNVRRIYEDRRAISVFLFIVILGSTMYHYSYTAIKGPNPPFELPVIGYSPVANLQNDDVSIKPPNWENEIYHVKEARLRKRNLRYARAYNAFLAKADLSEADLYRADLEEADLRAANLNQARLSQVKLLKANLENASLKFAELSRAVLNGASLKKAKLMGAILKEASLDNADLTEANLYRANLSHAHLQDACLKEADLRTANLYAAKLTGADLEKAKFEGADLRGANLFKVKNLPLAEVKNAKHWDLAFYDDDLLTKLELPGDHNEKVKIQLRKIKNDLKEEG